MQVSNRAFVGLVLAALCLVVGCGNPEPEDPFKDWSAAEKYRDYVPATAQPVAKGTGVLTFTTPEEGVLYVVDMTTMVDVEGVKKPKAIGSGLLPARSEVTFDPQQKRVYRKGREGVRLSDVDPSHTYELRFDPSVKKKEK